MMNKKKKPMPTVAKKHNESKNEQPLYTMTLDLKILDHLGINLYSNASAVLSEAVANSWDAEASEVKIVTDADSIVIEDDGIGMNVSQINKRFLNVGYDKWKAEGSTSPKKKRRFMGRKGIGKLALFSIANVIEVDTRHGSKGNRFRMTVSDIRRSIERKEPYHPTPLQSTRRKTGTTIRLSQLKKRRTAHGEQALRRRLARRFSIIGYKDKEGNSFDVIVNGVPIGPLDRDDLRALEFLWEFSDQPKIDINDVPELKNRFCIPNLVSELEHPEWRIGGWIGAVPRPRTLRSSESGSLHGIVVLARGRLIQENILDTLGFNRILNSYLTGFVEADFLDVEGQADIATSDRQRIVEDDERYESLVDFLRKTLLSISDQWTDLRNKTRLNEALQTRPALMNWIDSLPSGQREPAKKLIGLIGGIELEEEEQREDLFRSGVAAFERLRLREASHLLAEDPILTPERLLPLLSDMSALEGALYCEIVKSHLDVLKAFEGLIDVDAREKVLQKHLFDNLWLLDPGWERATGDARLEETFLKEFEKARQNLNKSERQARFDIRYRRNAGHHIIVELKKASRTLEFTDLQKQGGLYKTILRKCLAIHGDENPLISLVFVVGKPIAHVGMTSSEVDAILATLNARIVTYEKLIGQSRNAYQTYLDRSKEFDRIAAILGPRLSITSNVEATATPSKQ